MAIVDDRLFGLTSEYFARTSSTTGFRSFETAQDSANGPLCDEHGRLIVRAVTGAGLTDAGDGNGGTPKYVTQQFGSAPQYDNVGLVTNQRVMQRPGAVGTALVSGVPRVGRMFGYSAAAGFIQLIMKDESGGVNPPVVTDVPEVIIPIGALQNFVFSDYQLASLTLDLATYITFSSTGPTYTPVVALNLWVYYVGLV